MSFQKPKGFTIDLLEYLNNQAQYLHSLQALQSSNPTTLLTTEAQGRLASVQMSLKALFNVIKNNPGMISSSLICYFCGMFYFDYVLYKVSGLNMMKHSNYIMVIEVVTSFIDNY